MRITSALLAAASLLAGCSSGRENVVFITSTQIDIGYDASIGNLNLGYDRNELMIGPAYVETGALPPVAAALRSNLSIMEPKVSQVYTTGNAAIIATSPSPIPATDIAGSCPPPPQPAGRWVGCANQLSGRRAVMVFGTSSNLGLKVGFDATGATSLSLGYKRREASVIPLTPEQDRDPAAPDSYPSVLGSIEIDTTIANPQGTEAELGQFFATGRAAEQLATRQSVREAFGTYAEQSANHNFLKGVAAQKTALQQTASIAACVQRDGEQLTPAAVARLNALATQAGLTGDAAGAVRSATTQTRLREVLMEDFDNARPPMLDAVASGAVQCDT